MDARIFAGCFPTGFVYADRKREVAGDYKRLAYLNYATLKLDIAKDCPKKLADQIRVDAAQYRVGQQYATAWNTTVVLGSDLIAQAKKLGLRICPVIKDNALAYGIYPENAPRTLFVTADVVAVADFLKGYQDGVASPL